MTQPNPLFEMMSQWAGDGGNGYFDALWRAVATGGPVPAMPAIPVPTAPQAPAPTPPAAPVAPAAPAAGNRSHGILAPHGVAPAEGQIAAADLMNHPEWFWLLDPLNYGSSAN